MIEAGAAYGIQPAGLLALDVARIEAGLLLLDVDYVSARRALIADELSSPYELDLAWAVNLEKEQSRAAIEVVVMEALRKTTFRRNTIANNDVALRMFSNSDANVITENNFVNNLSPLQLVGKRTTTRWSENGRGNFWSDYDGYDLNEDGRGDVPQKIQNVFEYMEGNHPRLRFYLESPAARQEAGRAEPTEGGAGVQARARSGSAVAPTASVPGS